MSGGMPAGRVAQNAKSDVIVNDLPSAFIDRTGSRHSYGAGPMAVHVARNALHQETRRDLYSGNAGDPQLGYDGAHRLVQLKRTKVNGEHWQAEYAYDPLSRRIRKQVQYTDANGLSHPTSTTCYGWDGDQQSAEAWQDASDQWQIRTTLYEPGSFVPLLRMDQSQPSQEPAVLELKRQLAEAGEPLPDALREALAEDASDCRYASYHTDHLGTPLALTDELGKPLWEASPDDWAAVSNQQGSTDQPLRFQGQYEDEESGLYYNRHRYYDPKLGRYVNQDPIGLLGGMNSYAYPHAPTEWVDPQCHHHSETTRRLARTGTAPGILFLPLQPPGPARCPHRSRRQHRLGRRIRPLGQPAKRTQPEPAETSHPSAGSIPRPGNRAVLQPPSLLRPCVG